MKTPPWDLLKLIEYARSKSLITGHFIRTLGRKSLIWKNFRSSPKSIFERECLGTR